MAESDVTVTVLDNLDVELISGNSDENGYFELTVGAALTDGSVIKINTENSVGTISEELSYIVDIGVIEAPFNVVVNNYRTLISGKAVANSLINIYDNVDLLLKTITAESDGTFSEDLTELNTSDVIIKVDCQVASDYSIKSEITIPEHYVVNTLPAVAPVLISTDMNLIHKKIVKAIDNEDFELDFELDIATTSIKIKVTNNLPSNSSWTSNLRIRTINDN